MPVAKSLRRSLFAAALLSSFAVACQPAPNAPADARQRPDAGPPGTPDAPEDTPDAPPGSPDGGVPAGNFIYVNSGSSDSLSGKTPAEAVKKISTGIDRAKACTPRCTVRVAVGQYGDAFTMINDVDVEGGWSANFTKFDPKTNVVVISGKGGIAVDTPAAADKEKITALTTLSGVTIEGPDLSSKTDGSASIAVRVRDTTKLVLKEVTIDAGAGARGADGTDATGLTACSPSGGQGGKAQTTCTSAVAGGDGLENDPTTGKGGSAGNSDCSWGGNTCLVFYPEISGANYGGGNGTDGKNGSDGAAGIASSDDDGDFSSDAWTASVSGDGQNGTDGGGGGGGGAGGNKNYCTGGCSLAYSGNILGGKGGDGGNGGCGGLAGGAGTSGGASFGIVLLRATLSINGHVTIVGGTGGNGGNGGDGAGGASGVGGQSGAPGAFWDAQVNTFDYYAGNGGSGGKGGKGGHGGGGAGGCGGPAVGIAQVGGSSYQLGQGASVTNTPGTGGAAGTGGLGGTKAPDGVHGASTDTLTY